MKMQWTALSISLLCSSPAVCGSRGVDIEHTAPVPVQRITQALGEHLERHPEDAGAFYRLAQTHSLAYSLGTSSIVVVSRMTPPTPGSIERNSAALADRALPDISDEQRIEHLNSAIVRLNHAIRLDGDNPGYKLALASLLERARGDVDRTDAIPLDPRVLRDGRGIDRQWAARDLGHVREVLLSEPKLAMLDYMDLLSPQLALDSFVVALYELRADPDETVSGTAKRLVAESWETIASDLYFHAFCEAYASESSVRDPFLLLQGSVAQEAGVAYLAHAERHAVDAPQRSEVVQIGLKHLQSLHESAQGRIESTQATND